MAELLLGVNIDHIATLRNARGTAYPDPVQVIDNNTFTGHHLKALASREFPDVDTLRAAKRFTRIALKPYLGGKPLKSRELFRQFMPARKARADNTNND